MKKETTKDNNIKNSIQCISAKDEHIPGILAVFKEVGLGSDLNEEVLRKMREISNDLMIVALKDNQVTGVIISSFNGVSVWTSHVAVLPEYQKTGIASHLQNILEKHASELGTRRIIIDSWIDGAPFYRKRGYRLPGSIFMLKDLKVNKS